VAARSTVAELLVRVRVSLLVGAAPRLMDSPSTCRFCPRLDETLIFKFGALTVAVMELEPAPLGVVNPAGVAINRLAFPAPTGWKRTVVVTVSAFRVTGLPTIVPMVLSEVVTVTLTFKPVRMFWLAWAVRLAGFN